MQNKMKLLQMRIGTANYVITRQIQNSNIPFKYQVNLPWNTLVGLPKALPRKTNWKYWIEYIKPIWCPQHSCIERYYFYSPSIVLGCPLDLWYLNEKYWWEIYDSMTHISQLQFHVSCSNMPKFENDGSYLSVTFPDCQLCQGTNHTCFPFHQKVVWHH